MFLKSFQKNSQFVSTQYIQWAPWKGCVSVSPFYEERFSSYTICLIQKKLYRNNFGSHPTRIVIAMGIVSCMVG
jgi:hypothetical protein